jgi:hypothetical protein
MAEFANEIARNRGLFYWQVAGDSIKLDKLDFIGPGD